jgi:hypothetical protein
MISYGWQSVGTQAATAIITTPSPISREMPSLPSVVCDGYSYAAIALAHSNTGVAPVVDVYGVNFDSESSQSIKSVVANKIIKITGSANGVAISNGQFNVGYDGEWSAVASVTKETSFGTGSMVGLMMSLAGISGPEMSQTGTAASTFGSFDNDDYIGVAGSATVPGFVVIPCSLFSALVFSCSSGTAQSIDPLVCFFE